MKGEQQQSALESDLRHRPENCIAAAARQTDRGHPPSYPMDVGEAPELWLRELHVHINVLQTRDAPPQKREKRGRAHLVPLVAAKVEWIGGNRTMAKIRP